jgi:pSer/pThr/pTyr-binding forkhead associated (FHA) protein
MNLSQPPLSGASEQRTGPQGTQLLSAEELQRLSQEETAAANGLATTREPVLLGSSEGVAGRRYSLRSGKQTVGRRADNDIIIDEPSVSAAHAWIINHDGHYVILNTLSTNGTFVNDKRVHEAPLSHGDKVRLGHAEFVFLTREPGTFDKTNLRWFAVALIGVIVVAGLAWWWY